MADNIQDLLISVIRTALKKLACDELLPKGVFLDSPTDLRFGDLSTNIALQLSKTLKKPPRQIAADIVDALNEELKKNPVQKYVQDVKIEGAGFINFYLREIYFY